MSWKQQCILGSSDGLPTGQLHRGGGGRSLLRQTLGWGVIQENSPQDFSFQDVMRAAYSLDLFLLLNSPIGLVLSCR